jgi:hypothetical protein
VPGYRGECLKQRRFHTAEPLNTRSQSKNFPFKVFTISDLQTYVMPNRCDCRELGHTRIVGPTGQQISPAAQRVSETRKPVRALEMAFIPQAAMIRIS